MHLRNIGRTLLVTALAALATAAAAADQSYTLTFSTYIGGSDGWEHARDVISDAAGNVIMVGGTSSSDFPTLNAAQAAQDTSGTAVGSAGYCDAFIAKFDAAGQLLWSTYLGGPNYDRAYAVKVDSAGNIIVAGRGGPGFPVTSGAFQTSFNGRDAGIYGQQAGFVAKYSPAGALLWASYVGSNELCRDVDVGSDDTIYVPLNYLAGQPQPPAAWFTGAYRSTPVGDRDIGAARIAADGASVLWASWLGGTGEESKEAGIRVNAAGQVYLNCYTHSSDLPVTNGTSYQGAVDAYVGKLSADGSALLAGTYFGSSGDDWGIETHNIALAPDGDVIIAIETYSSDLPTTDGSSYHGNGDSVVVRFSSDLVMQQCIYLGGSGWDYCDGVSTDASGAVYISGATDSADAPITPLAYQSSLATPVSDSVDVVLYKLSADLGTMEYATYMGGGGFDFGLACYVDAAGVWYLTGSDSGDGWPVLNAYQPAYAGGYGDDFTGGSHAGDAILARFAPDAEPVSRRRLRIELQPGWSWQTTPTSAALVSSVDATVFSDLPIDEDIHLLPQSEAAIDGDG